ncbi:AAA domain containing protein [Comamonadaceae bacterium]
MQAIKNIFTSAKQWFVIALMWCIPMAYMLVNAHELGNLMFAAPFALKFSLFPRISEEAQCLVLLSVVSLWSHRVGYKFTTLEQRSQYGLNAYGENKKLTFKIVQYAGFFLAAVPLLAWMLIGKVASSTAYILPALYVALSAVGAYMAYINFGYSFGAKRSNQGASPQAQRQAPASAPNKGSTKEEDKFDNVARREVSSKNFDSIHGNKEIKSRLSAAAAQIARPSKTGATKRGGILLFGEPGNGKTVFAEAMAGELKLPLLTLTHSDVASRWVGERTEKIKAAFEQAIAAAPCVFFIDEIDSFLPDRSSMSNQTKEDKDVVNSLLTLLVDIRKHKVVVMAATNYIDSLDAAAMREGRFDFKVEITAPDEEARIALLTSGLRTNLPKVMVDSNTVKTVAKRWNGFSVKRILAVTEEMPSMIAERTESGTAVGSLQFDDFMAALRRIQGRKGASPENVKPMSDLVLPEVTKEALAMLTSRMDDPHAVESLGGSLPTGVLFHGPAGTGKTTACKALAKEVNWAFLITSGTDLARDPKAIEKLYAQAKELRPCIIFIDEADDLIRSRELSQNTEATNKLLTLMDGANDRVRDVVWVAATNHVDQIDAALLRGGRFTEKVEFVRPDAEQITAHIQSWVASRGVEFARGVDSYVVANMLGVQSIANVEAVLQYAVNRAISRMKERGQRSVVLAHEDVERGLTITLGSVRNAVKATKDLTERAEIG